MYGDVVLERVRASASSTASTTLKAQPRRRASTRSSTPTTGRRWCASYLRIVAGRDRQAVPAGPAASSSGARSARCSAPGTTQRAITLPQAQRHPATTGAPPSTCRRWCSATWATTAPPASPSRATPRPASDVFYGEYLMNAQGEDVVAGIRTPQPINKASRSADQAHLPTLEEEMPEAYQRARARSGSAREALPRHAGHRVHDPERASSGCCRRATASAPRARR